MSDRTQRWVIISLLFAIVAGGLWIYYDYKKAAEREEGVERYKELLEDRSSF
jgi:hypothetical protein